MKFSTKHDSKYTFTFFHTETCKLSNKIYMHTAATLRVDHLYAHFRGKRFMMQIDVK